MGCKSWFVFTLLVFITSQSILEQLHDNDNTLVGRSLVFGCECSFLMPENKIVVGRSAHARRRCSRPVRKIDEEVIGDGKVVGQHALVGCPSFIFHLLATLHSQENCDNAEQNSLGELACELAVGMLLKRKSAAHALKASCTS